VDDEAGSKTGLRGTAQDDLAVFGKAPSSGADADHGNGRHHRAG
jgi:hypothetical protein